MFSGIPNLTSICRTFSFVALFINLGFVCLFFIFAFVIKTLVSLFNFILLFQSSKMQSLIYSITRFTTILLIPLFACFIFNRFSRGISKIPGPWLASSTDLWRFTLTWTERAETTHVKLHAQYGDVVRLGPNLVSITDVDAIKKIYGAGSYFEKVW
jgi:hypothetical protein